MVVMVVCAGMVVYDGHGSMWWSWGCGGGHGGVVVIMVVGDGYGAMWWSCWYLVVMVGICGGVWW